MQSPIFSELNRACRYKDTSKLPTLGPYAYAFEDIIRFTQLKRTDKEKYDCRKQQDLWRGGGFTAHDIDQYKGLIGKKTKRIDDYGFKEVEVVGEMTLHGYTSTSVTKDAAM